MIRTLSCHCGQVRIACNAPLKTVTECNCSSCVRFGFLSWRVSPKQARLLTTRVGLATYFWRDTDGGTHFCKTCGASMMRTGWQYFTLNARCLEDVDIFTLEVRRYDGRTEMHGGDMLPLEDLGH